LAEDGQESLAVKTALFLICAIAGAQTQHEPRGAATEVSNDEINAIVKKTAAAAVSDTQIRVVGINNEYNVGVGVVHRARTQGKQTPNGIEHSQITEIYHVIEGNATLVTGGAMENPKDASRMDRW
jgi:hypothetical protein